MNTRYDEFDPAAHAAALLATGEAHVAGQHVVSRVVLKNFEGPVAGISKIGVYHVRFGSTRPIGRNKAGLAENLLRVGSTSAEALWARTENRIDGAVKAARDPNVDASALSLQVLRKAIALHFARSKVTVELLDGLWSERGSELVSAIVEKNRSLLTAHLMARGNRQPTESDLHELVRSPPKTGRI